MVGWMVSIGLAWALAPEVERAEAQFAAGDAAGCTATLEAYLVTHPDDPEALWRLGRSLYDGAEIMAQKASDAQRLPIYLRVQEVSRKAQALDPASGQGYLWEGVGLGRIATAKGILSQLFTADDIERLWLKALTTSTTYASASGNSTFPGDVWNGLGQFYRLCPDWAAMKWIAGTRGDIDKSIEYHRKLVSAEPDRIEAVKELGVSLLCKGDKHDDPAATEEGRQWLQKALALPARFATEKIDHQQIPVILSRADDACGYSRDGWEDLSEENVKK